MSHIPYYEELPHYGDDVHPEDRGLVAESGFQTGQSEDVMDQFDTVSLEELREHEEDQLSSAGVDPLTATDTFLEMNGESRYVTSLYPE